MYPWISRTLNFWLQFCEKNCGLYMDVYGTATNILHCRLEKDTEGNYEVIYSVVNYGSYKYDIIGLKLLLNFGIKICALMILL